MSIEEVATLVSAMAAIGAVGAAAFQIYGFRADAVAQRVGEIEGVSLVTKVIHRPTQAHTSDGLSRWTYGFTVHNPGRFPISHVTVRIHFLLDVQREHFDGSVGPVEQHLEMSVPVVAARDEVFWKRTILLKHEDRRLLRDTHATVNFSTPDGGEISTQWPAKSIPQRLDKRVVRLVRSEHSGH